MTPALLLALDQGTSSSRAIVFDPRGRIVSMAQRELRASYPRPGWVEHDPNEIWRTQIECAREALAGAAGTAAATASAASAGITANPRPNPGAAGPAAHVAAIGIANQRETTLVWRRASGEAVYPAIGWQDRRTEPLCAALRERGLDAFVSAKTGLRIDAYFSPTKLAWILDHVAGARAEAERGELAFGSVDTWLLWHLTHGAVHATDVSNASRTLLFDITRNTWDDELLALFGIPRSLLPAVQPSSHLYGHTAAGVFDAPLAIGGIAGDQQAALFGQACLRPGLAKNTYGTGCFLLMPTGAHPQRSANGLITTRAAQRGAAPQYALEGSVFIGGAVVQWLRDGLQAIEASGDVERLAASVPDSGGVRFVPAFSGLGAPYWQPHARGAIVGLTRGSTVAHIVRAALESIAFQSAALLQAMNRDVLAAGGQPVDELRVDGGACVNDLLMQFQADLLGIPVVRPEVIETTALGAACLAGLACGVWPGADAPAALDATVSSLWRPGRTFLPTLPRARAEALMADWEQAVGQAVR